MSAVLADAGFLAFTGRGVRPQSCPSRGRRKKWSGPWGRPHQHPGQEAERPLQRYGFLESCAAVGWSETQPVTLTTSEGGLSAGTLFGLRPDVWKYIRGEMQK